MSLYGIIRNEYIKKGMIRIPSLIERATSSIGCHLINQSNLHNPRFFSGGLPYNFRTSIIMMCPSGFGKSLLLELFLDPDHGLLRDIESIETSVRGTCSTESWMGTIKSDREGNTFVTEGIFSRFKEGIIGLDEFMRLKNMMEGSGIQHDEVYIMKALDSGVVTKDLADGSIEEKHIGTTIWAGMRLTPIDLSSGFARRFSFQVYFPTRHDAIAFKLARRRKQMNNPISSQTVEEIKSEMDSIKANLQNIKEIDLSEVESILRDDYSIPHFEEVIYDKLAIGFNVVHNPKFDGHVVVDKSLKVLFEDEKKSRKIIRQDPLEEAIMGVLSAEGEVKLNELITFFVRFYQVKDRLVENAIRTLGWKRRIELSGPLTSSSKRTKVSLRSPEAS